MVLSRNTGETFQPDNCIRGTPSEDSNIWNIGPGLHPRWIDRRVSAGRVTKRNEKKVWNKPLRLYSVEKKKYREENSHQEKLKQSIKSDRRPTATFYRCQCYNPSDDRKIKDGIGAQSLGKLVCYVASNGTVIYIFISSFLTCQSRFDPFPKMQNVRVGLSKI